MKSRSVPISWSLAASICRNCHRPETRALVHALLTIWKPEGVTSFSRIPDRRNVSPVASIDLHGKTSFYSPDSLRRSLSGALGETRQRAALTNPKCLFAVLFFNRTHPDYSYPYAGTAPSMAHVIGAYQACVVAARCRPRMCLAIIRG